LAHPVYGIANTHISPNRWVGWAFYFFMESFDAFFSTTFWAFADSINNPKDAKYYYGFIVAGSKIGGIISAGSLYVILHFVTTESQFIILPRALVTGSLFLFAAAFTIYMLIKKVSQDYMHGYEIVYQHERQKKRTRKTVTEFLKSPIEGLILIIKNPYVLGIFSLVLFYEAIIVIFDYWVALSADAATKDVGEMTAFYASYYFLFNLIGLGISIFGTTPLLRIMGPRISLFVFPLLCISMLLLSFFYPTTIVFFWVLIGLRAFNYALNHPTREILYIPTTKDIKYKAKTWTDAFGTRIAKSFGSAVNVSLKGATPAFALLSSISLSLSFTALWIIIVYFLGKTLQTALNQQKVIGEEEQESLQLLQQKQQS
jgi:AAA family ATP:ADP antiporter